MTTYIILYKGESIGEQDLDQEKKEKYENMKDFSIIKKGGENA